MKWPDTHTARITLAAAAFAVAVGIYALCTHTLGWPPVQLGQAANVVVILLAAAALCLTVFEAVEDRRRPEPDTEPAKEDA